MPTTWWWSREWTPELTGRIEGKLEGKFGPEINREKTCVVEVKLEGESLDFPGYAFRYDRDLKGCPRKFLDVFPPEKSLAREPANLREMTVGWYEHIENFGLKLLNRLPGRLTVNACRMMPSLGSSTKPG